MDGINVKNESSKQICNCKRNNDLDMSSLSIKNLQILRGPGGSMS